MRCQRTKLIRKERISWQDKHLLIGIPQTTFIFPLGINIEVLFSLHFVNLTKLSKFEASDKIQRSLRQPWNFSLWRIRKLTKTIFFKRGSSTLITSTGSTLSRNCINFFIFLGRSLVTCFITRTTRTWRTHIRPTSWCRSVAKADSEVGNRIGVISTMRLESKNPPWMTSLSFILS